MTAPLVQPYDLPTLRAMLESGSLIKPGAGLILYPYDAAFPRRPGYRRTHYRVESEKRPICHLIVGMDLARVYRQTEKFFQACPELICQPLLFREEADGTGYFCLEHFAGEPLEVRVREGRCTVQEWLQIIRRAQSLLAQTEKTSDQAALDREIHDLLDKVCSFPGFSEIDTKLIRELAGPVLIEQATFDPLNTRWSNGDFIDRNLLVDATGAVKMIDYEYAQPTHFWRADWLRLTHFSAVPPGLEISSIEEVAVASHPWQRIQFWLLNLSQLSHAEPCEVVDRHIAAIISELFKASERVASQRSLKSARSFLLTALANQRVEGGSFVQTPRDERYRERKIREDLEQANCRLRPLEQELSEKEVVIRSEEGAREQANLNINALAFELSRLRGLLVQTQVRVDRLLNPIDVTHNSASLDAQAFKRPAPVSDRPTYAIDHAETSFNVKGELSLTGWVAVPSSETCRVRLRLDRGNIFDCEVSPAIPFIPGVEGKSEKRFSVRTHAPAGLHIATLEYLVSPAQGWTPFCVRSLLVDTSPLFLRLERSIQPTRTSGPCQVQGWCFHPQEEIESISVRHGTTSAMLSYGLSRPDVGALHPQIRTAQQSGFSGVIELLPSQGDVVLTAVLRSGAILREIIARKIRVVEISPETTTQSSSAAVPAHAPGEAALCRLNEILQFGAPDTIRPFLREGWQEPEHGLRWAVGPRASLLFRFDPSQRPNHLRISLVPQIVPDRIMRQRIYVETPHGMVPSIAELTRNEPQEVIFHLPQAAFSEDVLNLQFSFPDARRPEEVGSSSDIRLLSVAFINLTFFR